MKINLIDIQLYIGSILVLVGITGVFFLVFIYGIWKPYIKKEKILQNEFAKVLRLVSYFCVMIGVGLAINVINPFEKIENVDSFLTTILGLTICLIGLPFSIVSLFAWHMKREHFIQDEKNKTQ